ncbi:MAG: response regulator transcription factor [Thermoanaerobaculia bacterium]
MIAPEKRVRVFIVDDHPLVREWLGALLGEQPDLQVCGQAEESVTALAEMLRDPPDIAIVDLTLKGGSGLDLIKDLTARLPSVRAIVLSMHEEVFYAERALRAGARGYVMKRESTSQIVAAIRQVNAGKVYGDPSLLSALAERIVGRPSEAASSPESLSDRELEVFRRLGGGHSTRRIADDLQISLKTVQTYCVRIREKLGLSDGAELVRAAVRWTEGSHH